MGSEMCIRDRAGMQVNAVLPLDDPDRALQLLASSFPIRVRTMTPWVVIVDRAGPVR